MNTIFCTCIKNPWIEIAEALNINHGIKPKYFLGFPPTAFDNSLKFEINKKFNNCHYQTIFDAIKGLNFLNTKKNNCYDEELNKLICHYEIIAIQMMNRFDPYMSSFPADKRINYFRDLIIKWLDIIDELNIELVISPSIPHRVYDYALYVATKIRKIRFITFKTIFFSDYAFIINDIEQNLLNKKINDNIIYDDLVFTELISYMNSVKLEPTSQLFYNEKKSNFNLYKALKLIVKRFIYWSMFFKTNFAFYVKKNKMPYSSNFFRFEILLILINRFFKLKLLKLYYENLVKYNETDKNNFVLVALHYQPEETTCPLGGIYVDQMLIIKMLDTIIDKNTVILVKEHSSQFNFNAESPESARDFNFYDEILKISPRIKFVSTKTKIFDLLPYANFVTTITGSVGFEALLFNKPVMCFGNPWYIGLPGVSRIHNKKDLETAVSNIQSIRNEITSDNIESFFKKLSSVVFPALTCAPQLLTSKTSLSVSKDNIVKQILLNIRDNNNFDNE